MRMDYVVVRGDDRTLDLDLTPLDAPLPTLAGATATFIVDGLFSADVDFDESSGDATVDIDGADTALASNVRTVYRYQVQVTESGGAVVTPQSGTLTILPTVDEP